jgi:hypothetical protein
MFQNEYGEKDKLVAEEEVIIVNVAVQRVEVIQEKFNYTHIFDQCQVAIPRSAYLMGPTSMSMFQTQDRGPQLAEPFFSDGTPKPTAKVITSGLFFDACKSANEISAVFNNGYRDTCILTSAALRDVLRRLGYTAKMMRIEAAVSNHAVDPSACILRFDGDGSRRRKAAPRMWRGHVGVVIGNVLLDPTLDQVNDGYPFMGATPMVVEFAPGQTMFFVPTGDKGAEVRFSLSPERCGWKAAPDFRFDSRRRPMIEAVLEKLGADGTATTTSEGSNLATSVGRVSAQRFSRASWSNYFVPSHAKFRATSEQRASNSPSSSKNWPPQPTSSLSQTT